MLACGVRRGVAHGTGRGCGVGGMVCYGCGGRRGCLGCALTIGVVFLGLLGHWVLCLKRCSLLMLGPYSPERGTSLISFKVEEPVGIASGTEAYHYCFV